MDELSDANRAGVAIPTDANRDELAVCQHRAGADRGHAAVHGVEPVRPAKVVRRRLARTADAGKLDDLLGIDPHLEKRIDDTFGNRVVPAPRAQGRLAAAIWLDFESDSICFAGHGHSPSVIEAPTT